MSAFKSLSRFLLNTVGTQTGSSMPQAHEPAKQQIILRLIHQLAFRPDREQDLDQGRSQQPLRRDRGAPVDGIEPGERGIERRQGSIDDGPDLVKRVICRNPLLQKTHSARPIRAYRSQC